MNRHHASRSEPCAGSDDHIEELEADLTSAFLTGTGSRSSGQRCPDRRKLRTSALKRSGASMSH
jgi:hypothetical protein